MISLIQLFQYAIMIIGLIGLVSIIVGIFVYLYIRYKDKEIIKNIPKDLFIKKEEVKNG